MPKNRSLLKAAKNVLNIKKQLHPLLFDENGIMFEHQRQKFLTQTDLIIKKTFKALENYEITDVILIGSSASYFYNEDSDFDVKILINLSKNPAVASNLKGFIKILNNTFYCSALKFRIDRHFVDIKFGTDDYFVMGNYSIMHNKWNISPRNDFKIKDIKAETLVRMFYESTAYMYEQFSLLPFAKGQLSFENLYQIRKVYDYFLLADKHVREDVDKGLIEFLYFKLIRKFLFLHQIIDMERMAVNDLLSLREEKLK